MSNRSRNNSDVGLNSSQTDSINEEHNAFAELEEHLWTLLGRSGLLGQLKGQIAKFIQENGQVQPDISKFHSRVDPIILQSIYDYLQWVGLKQTSALLLSESSVHIDSSRKFDEDEEPGLCNVFQKFSSMSAINTSQLQKQFDTPQEKGSANISSINIGNRTYTAGPVPQEDDLVISRKKLSQDTFFTPGTGSGSAFITALDGGNSSDLGSHSLLNNNEVKVDVNVEISHDKSEQESLLSEIKSLTDSAPVQIGQTNTSQKEESQSRSPTFLPYSGSSEKESVQLSRQDNEGIPNSNLQQDIGKAEDTFYADAESVSEFSSFVDNNTQDVSLSGSLSVDSRDLKSCDHIVSLQN